MSDAEKILEMEKKVQALEDELGLAEDERDALDETCSRQERELQSLELEREKEVEALLAKVYDEDIVKRIFLEGHESAATRPDPEHAWDMSIAKIDCRK